MIFYSSRKIVFNSGNNLSSSWVETKKCRVILCSFQNAADGFQQCSFRKKKNQGGESNRNNLQNKKGWFVFSNTLSILQSNLLVLLSSSMKLDRAASSEIDQQLQLMDSESFVLRCNALLFCTLLLRLFWMSLLFPMLCLLFCTLLCFHYNSACECKSELDTVSSCSFFYYSLRWIHLLCVCSCVLHFT